MSYTRRKVFVSYHHANDQFYADRLKKFYSETDTIIDRSLPEAFDSNDDDYILSQIRQKHLKDSTVTIVLIGQQTWARKWVDWEIYSSLRPYGDRTVNGLLGILLPGVSKNRLPPRFVANYKEDFLGNQIGYARLITWNMIAPPQLWQLFSNNEVQKKKEILINSIEQAFLNRKNTYLINNTLPRYKYNHSTNN
ncbi:TIR domain-containing protein [Thermoanaerobacterium thermosaccharolyticum]|uniref:TIR domain-containing protein n=1 Tax=Thermoanaerobacterium thermosaccharolyticum TaxID=1517 RepID=UPI00177DF976|nr:TIR domain-containing protein [Thermoanaerobacterium thermosaccharolyticum]MBE0069216.1 hypothetical protein [Thermoanaerobacterium thermosaccharolyticum]MBE0228112.1 hypothetical protein [Thermoanaerobacterium thermosaccharolyticum]